MSDLINRQSAIDAFYAYPNITWTTLEIMDVLQKVPSVDIRSLMQNKCKINASSDLISRQALKDAMYHEVFETDTEMQRWDSGCWIRYKLFENVIDNLPSADRKYKRALKIACELLNGAIIYGVDADTIFAYVLETDGCVGASDYEEFILNNIDRFSDNDEVRHKAIERLGW